MDLYGNVGLSRLELDFKLATRTGIPITKHVPVVAAPANEQSSALAMLRKLCRPSP